MEQKDKKKRSKRFLAILFGVIAAVIVLGAVFFLGGDSLEGEWVAKSEGFYADVDEDGKFTLKGAFAGTYVEVELAYTTNTRKKELTLSQGEQNAYKEALMDAKDAVAEDKLREAIEPFLASYAYSLENDTLTLTEQKSGEQIVFTKANKIKLEIATTTGDVASISESNEEALRKLHETGFKYIDFSNFNFVIGTFL